MHLQNMFALAQYCFLVTELFPQSNDEWPALISVQSLSVIHVDSAPIIE